MAHPASITDEEVFVILDGLDTAGTAITPNRVRTEAGGGNPSRYRALIERWLVARSLESDPSAGLDGNPGTVLCDEIARSIELCLFARMGFLDKHFRASVSRELAGRVGGTLIRRGLVNEGALGRAPLDPFAETGKQGP